MPDATILAPELAAHLTIAPDLEPGCLCVFEDYAGRDVTARVKSIADGTVVMSVAGLAAVQHGVYRIGDVIARDIRFVRRAI
jgi:hypothetical protein